MPPAMAGADEAEALVVKKDLQLFISITFPLLFLFLVLVFDRPSLSSPLLAATMNPVSYSLSLYGMMLSLPSILAIKSLKLLFLAGFALACAAIVGLTMTAPPPFPWEIGLYLSLAAWGACVDAVLEAPPFLSLGFSLLTIGTVILHYFSG